MYRLILLLFSSVLLWGCADNTVSLELEKTKRVEAKYRQTKEVVDTLSPVIQRALESRDMKELQEHPLVVDNADDFEDIKKQLDLFMTSIDTDIVGMPKHVELLLGKAEEGYTVEDDIEVYAYSDVVTNPTVYHYREDNTGSVELVLEYPHKMGFYTISTTWIGGVHVETLFTYY